MTETRRIAILVGSLRERSYNGMAARALAELAPEHLEMRFISFGDLALYDEDLEKAGPPEPWLRFRKDVSECQAVLFVTPEYNRSVPGGLKNAIDVGSRPYGHSVWARKPAAIMSVSPGAIGGFGANHHLRQSLVFLDMPVLQQPEAYVGGAAKLFDGEGKLVNDGTREFFTTFINAFAALIEKAL